MGKNYCSWLWLCAFAMAGYADDELEIETTKRPIGADFYVTNNVGAGTAFTKYQQDPYVASTLYLYPYYKTAAFLGEREFRLQTELSSVVEWMSKGNPINGSVANKLGLGDLKVRAEFKKALYHQGSGIALSPALKLEAPLSKASRESNRVIGLGGYINATWSKWGLFLSYKPVALGFAYSVPYKSGSCPENSGSDDVVLGDVCKIAGRQTMALIKNGLFGGYTYGNHTATIGFRSYHQILRKPNSGEKAEEKPTSGVLESSLGVVEYAYKMESTWPTTLSLGVSSMQNPYDMKDGFRMPFFSFKEPSKNQTEAYVALNVSI